MEIISAQIAREQSILPQLNRIMKLIKEAVEAGESEIILKLNNGIYHENIELLRNNGYDVIEYESEYEIIKTIISWKRVHFAENGTFSRGYYIKNQERTENDE